MRDKFSAICFCREDYKKMPDVYYGQAAEYDEAQMLDDIRDFVRIALKNGYQMRIWNDGLTTCIEYNYLDESLSGVSLNWLGENEYVDTYEPVTVPNNNAQKGN